MVFSTAAKVTADIVEEIATKLIASTGGYWTDIIATDPGATVWTTVNKAIGNNAKRALKFDNGIETPLFFAFEVINQLNGLQFYCCNWQYGKGIRIVVSPTWDSTGHTYPTTGIQSSFMPFETCDNCTVNADLATEQITYYLWVEDNGNGFVVMGKPEPTGSNTQQSFIIVLERADTIKKRYVDGYSNFYVYTAGNIRAPIYDSDNTTSIVRNRLVLRPFAYQFPDTPPNSDYNNGFMVSNGNGISFPPLPTYYAYKSSGNGKVYFIKPIIHNQANSITPIFQSELFFVWSDSAGLVDGDVVAIQGQPIKFLCKALDSPDNTARLTFAIKYVG